MRTFTINQAAQELGVNWGVVKRLVASGKVEPVTVDGYMHPRLTENDLCQIREIIGSRTRKDPRVARRAYHLFRTFGITVDQYEEMFAKQKGLCAICKQPETETRAGRVKALTVDHSHRSGRVRGLLCHSCNRKLGVLEDRKFRKRAEKYLKRFAA